jgi:hypothetical protein
MTALNQWVYRGFKIEIHAEDARNPYWVYSTRSKRLIYKVCHHADALEKIDRLCGINEERPITMKIVEDKPYCVIARTIVDQSNRRWLADEYSAVQHAASYLDTKTREMLVVKIVKVVRRKHDYEVLEPTQVIDME